MRRLHALLAVGALVVGALAIALLAGGGGHSSASVELAAEGGDAYGAGPPGSAALDRVRRESERAARRGEAAAVRHVAGNPREEQDAGARERLRFAAERGAAEPVARRFLAAFARYELGHVSAHVAAELRDTATDAFAGELLGAPPARIPPATGEAARAVLERLEFVPGESERGRLVSLEFVVTVDRDGERTPLAITLRRVGAAWLVAALGR